MEGDSNTMLAIILMGLAVLTLLVVSDDDDGSSTVDSSDTVDDPDSLPAGGVEGDNGVSGITPANADGDNNFANGSNLFDLSQPNELWLGAGDDSGFTGNGDDTIYVQSGDDWMSGATGNDTLHGGLGNDTAIGGWGDDALFLGLGQDSIHSAELDAQVTDAIDGKSVSDADSSLNDLQSALYNEMGGDDNALGGVTDSAPVAGSDSGDDLIDLIGANNLIGGVGNDLIIGIDRDTTQDGAVPKGDVLNGGFNSDTIWADDADTVQLDPLAEEANKAADHLVIANALSGRGEVADIAEEDNADETVDATDYVTVVDFNPAQDMLTVLSETVTADSLTYEQQDDDVLLKSGDEILALFQNSSVADFDGFSATVSANVDLAALTPAEETA